MIGASRQKGMRAIVSQETTESKDSKKSVNALYVLFLRITIVIGKAFIAPVGCRRTRAIANQKEYCKTLHRAKSGTIIAHVS